VHTLQSSSSSQQPASYAEGARVIAYWKLKRNRTYNATVIRTDSKRNDYCLRYDNGQCDAHCPGSNILGLAAPSASSISTQTSSDAEEAAASQILVPQSFVPATQLSLSPTPPFLSAGDESEKKQQRAMFVPATPDLILNSSATISGLSVPETPIAVSPDCFPTYEGSQHSHDKSVAFPGLSPPGLVAKPNQDGIGVVTPVDKDDTEASHLDLGSNHSHSSSLAKRRKPEELMMSEPQPQPQPQPRVLMGTIPIWHIKFLVHTHDLFLFLSSPCPGLMSSSPPIDATCRATSAWSSLQGPLAWMSI
jgi:hypothetical protein